MESLPNLIDYDNFRYILRKMIDEYQIPTDYIARKVDVSGPTIERWYKNRTNPHKKMLPAIYKILEEIIKENDQKPN